MKLAPASPPASRQERLGGTEDELVPLTTRLSPLQSLMRVVSFITQPRLIRRILDHLAGRATQQRAHLRHPALSLSSADPLSSRPPPPRWPGRVEVRLDRDLLAPTTRLKVLEGHRDRPRLHAP